MPFNSTGINAERKEVESPIKADVPRSDSDEEWLKKFLDTMDFDPDENCKYNNDHCKLESKPRI